MNILFDIFEAFPFDSVVFGLVKHPERIKYSILGPNGFIRKNLFKMVFSFDFPRFLQETVGRTLPTWNSL